MEAPERKSRKGEMKHRPTVYAYGMWFDARPTRRIPPSIDGLELRALLRRFLFLLPTEVRQCEPKAMGRIKDERYSADASDVLV
jgi:hypothetical protein